MTKKSVFGRQMLSDILNKKTGLSLYHMPTGHGKTHSVLDAVFEYFSDGIEDKKRRVFFISTRRNTVWAPYEELGQRFKAAGMDKWFEKNSLLLKGRTDIALSFFDNRTEIKPGLVPDRFLKLTSMFNLKVAIKRYRMDFRYEGSGSALTQKSLKDVADCYQAFCQDVKNVFYKDVGEIVGENIKKAKAENQKDIQYMDEFFKVRAEVFANKEWQWVRTFFPESSVIEKQIIFLTASKFLKPIDFFVRRSSELFTADDLMSDSLIIVDEWDDFFGVLQSELIASQIKNRIDLLKTAESISDSVRYKELPLRYACEESAVARYGSLRKSVLVHYDKFHLENEYDLENVEKFSSQFVFNSCLINFTSGTGKDSYVAVRKENRLGFVEKKPIPNTFYDLLFRISEDIRKAGSFFYFLPMTVMKKINMDNKGYCPDIYFLRDDLLGCFTFSDAARNALMNSGYRFNFNNSNNDGDGNEVDKAYNLPSFFVDGLDLFILSKSNNYSSRTRLNDLSITVTPERFILYLASKVCITGISATACIDKSLSNFDIYTFRSVLGNKYSTFNSSQLAEVKGEMELLENEYGNKDKVDSRTEIVEFPSSDNMSIWNGLLGGYAADIVDDFVDFCIDTVSIASYDDFNRRRIYNVINMMDKFYSDVDLYSMIYIGNKLLLKSDVDRQVIVNIITKLANIKKYKNFDSAGILELNAINFDFVWNKKAVPILQSGGKCFIISTYSSLARGVNLLYPVPEILKDKMVILNSRSSDCLKDIDAIYLENLTNVFDYGSGGNLVSNRDDVEFQVSGTGIYSEAQFVSYLLRFVKCHTYGQLSGVELRKVTQGMWRSLLKLSGTDRNKKLKNKTSRFSLKFSEEKSTLACKNMITAILVQALGRVQRSPIKNPERHIYIDHRLCSMINYELDDSQLLLNSETTIVLQKMKAYYETVRDVSPLKIIDTWSQKLDKNKKNFIRSIMRSNDLPDETRDTLIKQINIYEDIYDFVLKVGYDFDEINVDGGQLEAWCRQALYFDSYVPDCSVVFQDGNYCWSDNIPDNNFDVFIYPFPEAAEKIEIRNSLKFMSPERFHFGLLLQIDGLEEHFKSQNWRLNAGNSRYMLRPLAITQFYLLALGEAVGQFVMHNEYGLDLVRITDLDDYERFDYRTSDKLIYVDFKYWLDSTMINYNVLADKAFGRAVNVGCRNVAYIKIFLDADNVDYQCESMSRVIDGIEYKVWVIPGLYVVEGGKIRPNPEAIKTIEVLKNEVYC